MRTKKALLAALCACLLVVGSVMGTMAYLTATENVVNTFTVGSITFGDGANEKGLDEAKTDEYGVKADPEVRVQTNTYKLVPGHTYVKDPTVHIKNDSESCYLFVKVENGISDIEAASEAGGYQNIADQLDANGWDVLTGVDNVYYQSWAAADGAVESETDDVVVFSNFKVAGTANNKDVADHAAAQIVVTAYAVQADGFKSAAEAWTATFGVPSTSD